MYASRTRAAVGVTVALGGLSMVGTTAPAQAQEQAQGVAGCHAADLSISKGRLDAGMSQRYQDIKIKNVSDSACRLTGYPTFTFQRNGAAIGWASTPEAGEPAHTVVIAAGDTAYTTLHWTDPGPVPASKCKAKDATGVIMTLPSRPHAYRIVLAANVCTTKQYLPSAFPIRDGRAL
jgi:hypothetical protein